MVFLKTSLLTESLLRSRLSLLGTYPVNILGTFRRVYKDFSTVIHKLYHSIADNCLDLCSILQPFHVAETFTGVPGKYVPLKETIRGFKMIISGEMDEYPENAFFNVGGIDEVIEKAKAETGEA